MLEFGRFGRGRDPHRNRELAGSLPAEDSPGWRHVGVIAADSGADVAVARQQTIGRIEPDLAGRGAVGEDVGLESRRGPTWGAHAARVCRVGKTVAGGRRAFPLGLLGFGKVLHGEPLAVACRQADADFVHVRIQKVRPVLR